MGGVRSSPEPPKISRDPRLPLAAGSAPVYSLPGLQLPKDRGAPASHWPLVPRQCTHFLDYNSRKTAGPRRTLIEPGLWFPSCPAAREGPSEPGLSPKYRPSCSPSASLNRKCPPEPQEHGATRVMSQLARKGPGTSCHRAWTLGGKGMEVSFQDTLFPRQGLTSLTSQRTGSSQSMLKREVTITTLPSFLVCQRHLV